MRHRPLDTGANWLVALFRTGIVVGVVVAALLLPLAAVAGLGIKNSTGKLENRSEELRNVQPAQTSYVYANDGKTLLTMFYEEHRRYTRLDDMSPHMQQAIVAAEDTRFFQHPGVDAKGIARAFVANSQSGGVSQGASTLTMQYTRLALRDSAKTPLEAQQATEQTTVRKVREMQTALNLEKVMSKPEILEKYLNAAYFGHRAYGVYAAAEIFFSKAPKDLSAVEAATLAGLVKSPSEYDPATSDQQAARDRRNWVLGRMSQMGYLSPAETAQAQSEPIRIKLTDPPNECVSVPKSKNNWGFFCDYLKNWWMTQPAFGDNSLQREDNLRRGGYRIVTSLDPKMQEVAESRVRAKEGDRSPFAHGLVLVEPGTGRVKAMAVNRVYSLDLAGNAPNSNPALRRQDMKGNYPNTVTPLLGGGDLPGYQAGSTFKMFTMLAALQAGMPLDTAIDSPHRYQSRVYPGWAPSNASGAMTGRQTMWSGFGKSVNTYFVQLEERVGAEKAVRLAEQLGLRWRTDVDRDQASPEKANKWGAFTLGVSDATPLEMANAYAAIAADGRYCDATPVVSVTRPDEQPATFTTGSGISQEVAKPSCRQVLTQETARAATDAARCPVGDKPAKGTCGGWSTADSVRNKTGRPVAGKTGTTDSTRSAWFVGYTPQLSAASFISDPDNPFNAVGDAQSQKPVDSVAEVLRDALKDQPVKDFKPPSGRLAG